MVTVTRPLAGSSSTARRMPSSSMVMHPDLRVHHRRRAASRAALSPLRSRVGAVQHLHLGEQVGQVLGVHAGPPTGRAPSRCPAGSASPRPAPGRRPRRTPAAGWPGRPAPPGPRRTARGCTARPGRRRPASAGATPRCRRRAASPTARRGPGGTPTPCAPSRRSRPAARPAQPASAVYSGSWYADRKNSFAMVTAKSPLGSSTSRQLRNSRSSRRYASASSSRPAPSSSPAYDSSRRAAPSWSRAMLASAMSSSISGARVVHSASRWAATSASSPSARAKSKGPFTGAPPRPAPRRRSGGGRPCRRPGRRRRPSRPGWTR